MIKTLTIRRGKKAAPAVKADPPATTLKRIYPTSVESLWAWWTTKTGIEAWWGPPGFAVTVRRIDVRPGGALHYAMTPSTPDTIAFVRRSGLPFTTELRLTYVEVMPHRRLAYRHLVDFVRDIESHEVNYVLELHASSQSSARLNLTFDAMHNAAWTQRQVSGWESELDKLASVLNSVATHSGSR